MPNEGDAPNTRISNSTLATATSPGVSRRRRRACRAGRRHDRQSEVRGRATRRSAVDHHRRDASRLVVDSKRRVSNPSQGDERWGVSARQPKTSARGAASGFLETNRIRGNTTYQANRREVVFDINDPTCSAAFERCLGRTVAHSFRDVATLTVEAARQRLSPDNTARKGHADETE
jgi:hypothetical protein